MTLEEGAFHGWDALKHPRDRLGRWRDVIAALRGMGINAHSVGGSVRDELLGRTPKDHDFLAAGTGHGEIRAAAAKHGKVEDLVVAGRQVGVRLYPHGENFSIEITPPRKEVSTGPGHKDFEIVADPNVSIEEDLARRDFTVNAMARNLDTREIIDPHGGQEDLRNGVLRTVTPDSFRDDPLRIVRGLRFVSTLGLTPDKATLEQMRENAAGIDALSGERIQEQMDKLLMGDEPARALRLARDTGVLGHLYPEFAPVIGFGQESKYHDLTADEHTFEVVQAAADAGASLDVRLAALFHDSGKPEAAWRGPDGHLHYYGSPDVEKLPHEAVGARKWRAVAARHRYEVDRREAVAALIEHHMFRSHDRPTDIKARRFLAEHGRERAFDLIAHKRADIMGKESDSDSRISNELMKLDDFEARLRSVLARGHAFHRSQLRINGADLRALGFPEGKLIGEVLAALLAQVLGQPELNNREWLLRQAQKRLGRVVREGVWEPDLHPRDRIGRFRDAFHRIAPGTRFEFGHVDVRRRRDGDFVLAKGTDRHYAATAEQAAAVAAGLVGQEAGFSKNVRLPKSGKAKGYADRVARAIDGLLALPPMPPVDVKGHTANAKLGRYRRRAVTHDGTAYSVPESIGFSMTEKPHLTLAHEIGHYLDNEAFRPSLGSSRFETRRATLNAMEPLVREEVLNEYDISGPHGWLHTVEPSPLDGWLKTVMDSEHVHDLTTDVPYDQVATHRYLLRPSELFARSFAQWLAIRSGDPEMLRELRIVQGREGAPPVSKYWDNLEAGDVIFRPDRPEPFVIKSTSLDKYGRKVLHTTRGGKLGTWDFPMLGAWDFPIGWRSDQPLPVYASLDDARVEWYRKHPRQWRDEDFELVAAALERAFERAGLLKRKAAMSA